MSYSAEQKEAIRRFGRDLVVFAGAGSGKTALLAERFLYAVTRERVAPDKILAITFTEKAAHEMKLRVVRQCEEKGLSSLRQSLENASISTIHSFCARVLRENPIESGVDPFFQILNEAETELLMSRVTDRLFEVETQNETWLAILTEVGEQNVRAGLRTLYGLGRASADDKRIFRCPQYTEEKKMEDITRPVKLEFLKMVSRFKELYESEKMKRAAYDFEDLVYLVYRLFSDPAPQCRAVLSRYQSLFSRVLVDEYQDTSSLQAAIIDHLKKDNRLFFVGDVQQSIYGFRHADPLALQRLLGPEKNGKNFEKVFLSRNHRSRGEILSWVNHFFKTVSGASGFLPLEAGKKFSEERSHALEILCIRRDEVRADSLEKARVLEARALAARIRELVSVGLGFEGKDGISRPAQYRDFAILLKSTTFSHLYERELSEAGIPFYALKGKGFYEKPEILDLLSCLTLLEDPDDDIALACVLRSPLVAASDDALFWLAFHAKGEDKQAPLSKALERLEEAQEISGRDRESLGRFREWIEALRFSKDRRKLSELLGEIFARTQYEAKLLAQKEGRQKIANVLKFVEIASSLEEREILGVGDFVRAIRGISEEELMEAEAQIESGDGDVVTVSTIHAAKGLEFPCVIIADMGAERRENSLPVILSTKETGLGMKWPDPVTRKRIPDYTYTQIESQLRERRAEEDSRVLYVAMTRAKEHLIFSGSLPARPRLKDDTWMEKLMSVVGTQALESTDPLVECGGVRFKIIKPTVYSGSGAAPDPLLADRLGLREVGMDPTSVSVEKALKLGVRIDPESPRPGREPVDYRKRFEPVLKDYTHTQDLTVTDVLMQSLVGPERASAGFEEDRVLGTDREESQTPRNEFGVLYHKLMQNLATERPKTVRNRLFDLPFLDTLGVAEKEEMKQSVLKFWRGPLGALVRQARRCYPELPFIYQTRHGVLKGQIDLVLQSREGKWMLLDYKTNRLEPAGKIAAAETYRVQLLLYALVFGRLYGEFPVKGMLYFSSLDDTAEFPYLADDFTEAERMLDEAFLKTASP